MSQENVALVRRIYQAWNHTGLTPEALGLFDERVELRLNVLMGSYRGHDGVRRFVSDLMEEFRELTIEVDEAIDVGDQVVVVLHEHAVGRTSGVPTDSVQAHVWTVRDGRACRGYAYPGKESALEAVDVGSTGRVSARSAAEQSREESLRHRHGNRYRRAREEHLRRPR
jgi:ketosteroid isomerase-like protein